MESNFEETPVLQQGQSYPSPLLEEEIRGTSTNGQTPGPFTSFEDLAPRNLLAYLLNEPVFEESGKANQSHKNNGELTPNRNGEHGCVFMVQNSPAKVDNFTHCFPTSKSAVESLLLQNAGPFIPLNVVPKVSYSQWTKIPNCNLRPLDSSSKNKEWERNRTKLPLTPNALERARIERNQGIKIMEGPVRKPFKRRIKCGISENLKALSKKITPLPSTIPETQNFDSFAKARQALQQLDPSECEIVSGSGNVGSNRESTPTTTIHYRANTNIPPLETQGSLMNESYTVKQPEDTVVTGSLASVTFHGPQQVRISQNNSQNLLSTTTTKVNPNASSRTNEGLDSHRDPVPVQQEKRNEFVSLNDMPGTYSYQSVQKHVRISSGRVVGNSGRMCPVQDFNENSSSSTDSCPTESDSEYPPESGEEVNRSRPKYTTLEGLKDSVAKNTRKPGGSKSKSNEKDEINELRNEVAIFKQMVTDLQLRVQELSSGRPNHVSFPSLFANPSEYYNFIQECDSQVSLPPCTPNMELNRDEVMPFEEEEPAREKCNVQ